VQDERKLEGEMEGNERLLEKVDPGSVLWAVGRRRWDGRLNGIRGFEFYSRISI
jgi:hypothetical protein